MPQITVNSDIAVPNGPAINFNRTLDVEAFDMIGVKIASGDTDKEVQIQPGGAGQVEFLLIVSDAYDPKISYKVNKAANPARSLDQPHLFPGTGSVSALDAAAPGSLFFSNATAGVTAKDANIQILVGRDATP